MPHLTPHAERALCAYLEDALYRDNLSCGSTDPWGCSATTRHYAPLDFNNHSVPYLPDWEEDCPAPELDYYDYQ